MGVAVNVTDVPAQILLADEAMLMAGVTLAFTIIVILLLVADGVDKHVALLVNTQVIISLLFNVDKVNVGLFVPTFVPFIFHW